MQSLLNKIATEIKAEQGSDEWHKARLGRATASQFDKVMATGKNGYQLAGYKNYRAELVLERLTGQAAEFYTNAAMQWGTETEPLARLRYALTSGNSVEECGFFAHDTLMAGASPDGLIGDDGILEIKCPMTATHIETLHTKEIPRQYYWQVMGQLWITGRKWADFVSFDPRLPDNAAMFVTRIQRDEEDIEDLEDMVARFLKNVVEETVYITNYKP